MSITMEVGSHRLSFIIDTDNNLRFLICWNDEFVLFSPIIKLVLFSLLIMADRIPGDSTYVVEYVYYLVRILSVWVSTHKVKYLSGEGMKGGGNSSGNQACIVLISVSVWMVMGFEFW